HLQSHLATVDSKPLTGTAKFFRCNTYAKTGGGGYFSFSRFPTAVLRFPFSRLRTVAIVRSGGRANCRREAMLSLRGNGRVRSQLGAQAPLEFLAHLRDLHPRHHDELAAQHLVRLVVIRQLTAHTAVLAILIPAEAAVGNRLRANELEAAQQRITLRHLKLLSKNNDVNQFFVRAEGFRHDESCSA